MLEQKARSMRADETLGSGSAALLANKRRHRACESHCGRPTAVADAIHLLALHRRSPRAVHEHPASVGGQAQDLPIHRDCACPLPVFRHTRAGAVHFGDVAQITAVAETVALDKFGHQQVFGVVRHNVKLAVECHSTGPFSEDFFLVFGNVGAVCLAYRAVNQREERFDHKQFFRIEGDPVDHSAIRHGARPLASASLDVRGRDA
mmetsp:Transcript_27847/g.83925  ORF Transcript_27847/g.83925 Transcript_27847/m.83925 type:complete len:205 (-) Transcript_27847:461-1075(-)